MHFVKNKRFGLLVAVADLGVVKHATMHHWRCICDCGEVVDVRIDCLRRGLTVSCGCHRRSVGTKNLEARTTHGQTGHPLWDTWYAMIDRCTNPGHTAWSRYGGRGVGIDPSWLGPDGFDRFVASVGPRPSEAHTLDRKDNDGHYTPGNVRWSTKKQQSRNRSNTRWLTWYGKTQDLQTWAEQLGMRPHVIEHRLARGWDIDRALSTPARRYM